MRIAILSDIHANLPALLRSLEFCRHQRVDQIICLGDIVGYGAQPNECIDLIRQHCAHVVLGNHDAVAVGLLPLKHLNTPGQAAMRWTLGSLSNENLHYLASLPLQLELEGATFVHASPNKPERWTYITDPFEAEEAFGAMSTELCFFGHTHVPGLLCENPSLSHVKKGHRFLINVGSVGQPRDGNPQLSLGIFNSKSWSYENFRLDYNIQQAAEAILRQHLPPTLAHRLYKGI